MPVQKAMKFPVKELDSLIDQLANIDGMKILSLTSEHEAFRGKLDGKLVIVYATGSVTYHPHPRLEPVLGQSTDPPKRAGKGDLAGPPAKSARARPGKRVTEQDETGTGPLNGSHGIKEDRIIRIRLFFDGASRGNPGESGAGWVVEIHGRKIEGQAYLGLKTNNQAEYLALIRGLQEAERQRPEGPVKLTVSGDSDLVTKQMTGEWAIKNKNLRELHAKAEQLLAGFDNWSFEWIVREENSRADQLANSAIDRKSFNNSRPDE